MPHIPTDRARRQAALGRGHRLMKQLAELLLERFAFAVKLFLDVVLHATRVDLEQLLQESFCVAQDQSACAGCSESCVGQITQRGCRLRHPDQVVELKAGAAGRAETFGQSALKVGELRHA